MADRCHRLTFRLAPEREGVLVGELWAWGTTGTQSRERGGAVELDAYFALPPAELGALRALRWDRFGARLVACEVVEPRDWLAAYRRLARPIAVGRSFVVDPGEGGRAATDGAPPWTLALPARTAFGTGSHASTRLAVELLEAVGAAGSRVLDVGAGSGILTFAAVLLGAAWVVGVEVDPAAALVAGQNRRANAVACALVAGGVDCLAAARRFDLALVNIDPETIGALLPAISARLRAGAGAVFSGFLEERVTAVGERLAAAGHAIVEQRNLEGWSALRTIFSAR